MRNNTQSKIIGISGDVGSFSEEAGLRYMEKMQINLTLKYLIDMEGVLSELNDHKIDIGILPVVNLRGGLVRMAFEAMGKYQYKLIDELWLEVNHCLLMHPNGLTNKLHNIVSHPQAFLQCGNYLQKHFSNTSLTEWQDTAIAARELANGHLSPITAVIAPERAAHIYGLNVVAKNIQDENPNLTAFIIVERINKTREETL